MAVVIMVLLLLLFSCSVVSNSLQPMDYSTPGFPVLHYLLEFAQTHVHWVSDAIQPAHPLLPPSPPAFNLSQHQGLFQWVSSSHQVAKLLELQLQHQSFQWIFRTDFLYNWLVWSPCNPRDSQKSSPAPQFKSINSSVLSFLYKDITHKKRNLQANVTDEHRCKNPQQNTSKQNPTIH